MMHGFTENYIKVKTPYDVSLFNRLTEVALTAIDDDGCVTCHCERSKATPASYIRIASVVPPSQ
jgi:hypothetical protein